MSSQIFTPSKKSKDMSNINEIFNYQYKPEGNNISVPLSPLYNNSDDKSIVWINLSNYIFIPSNFITSMKDLSEKSDEVIYFQNISEVVVQSWNRNPPSFNYYIVLLLLNKREDKKPFSYKAFYPLHFSIDIWCF